MKKLRFTNKELAAVREAVFYYLHEATTRENGIAGLFQGDKDYSELKSALGKIEAPK
jgi:hypothetical protein